MSNSAAGRVAVETGPATRPVRLVLILICACWLSSLPSLCRAAESEDAIREDHLRAGYLLNFAKFVEWTAPADSGVLTFCFVGGVGIRDSLASGAGDKKIGTRALVTRVLSGGASPDGCQVLYIESAAPFSKDYQRDVVNPSLLTVSDARDFVKTGGVVELFSDSNRLRFNVNLYNARRNGLKMSSSLLQLASHVEGAAQ